MSYCLSPLVIGPRGHKYPLGWDSQSTRNWILLDQDRALLWVQDDIQERNGLVRIAGDKQERLAVTSRDTINNFIGRDYRTTQTIQECVVDMMFNSRFGTLQPSKVRQQYEILLGPNKDFWREPVVVPPSTVAFVDAFTRSDGDLDGDTSTDGLFAWVNAQGGAWTITSNQARCAGAVNYNVYRTSVDTDSDNSYAFATITGFTRVSANLFVGFSLRGSLYNVTNDDGYAFEVGNSGTAVAEIYRFDGGGTVDSSTDSITSGVLRFECDGSTLRGLHNGGEILSGTNSTYTGGSGSRKAAINGYSDNAGNSTTIDDFGYGDLVAGGSVVPVIHHHDMIHR